jgi:putative tryptophan/tyrosine transport system substrate-binding protein
LQFDHLIRRDFISLLAGAAAWPIAERARETASPIIGLLGSSTPKEWAPLVAAFLNGLSETGFVVGGNVAIEYRWAEDQYDRLPSMAAELIELQVSVIAALTTPAAVAAKGATTTTPIVFTTIGDPVQLGLVDSLSHPGGNITGVTYLNVEIAPKLLELLHDAVPTATAFALLVNPTNPNADNESRSLQAAAHTLGLEPHVLNASTDRDIDTAFASLVRLRVGGLVIVSDVFLNTRAEQLAALALRSKLPAVCQTRAFTEAGGLMSYTGSAPDVYRQAGIYTGRVLTGEKPAELPVIQATKVELFINLKTAKALGLTVPMTLLGRADEVIE